MVMMKLVVLLFFSWTVVAVVGYDLLEALSWSAGHSRQGSTSAVRDDDDGFAGKITRPKTLALSSSSSFSNELEKKNTKKKLKGGDSAAAAADELMNSPLSCHQCHSFVDGQRCTHLAANSTVFQKSCNKTETSCMVKRFSFTENATSSSLLWSIERNCSTKCEPGCLILGDRTRLYVCTSCCKNNSCNVGSSAVNRHRHGSSWMMIITCSTCFFFFLVDNHKPFSF